MFTPELGDRQMTKLTRKQMTAWHLEHAERLKPRQRNDPPWGESMTAAEYAVVHLAWVKRLKKAFRFVSAPNNSRVLLNQCGGCRYYMPIEGEAGADWGACGNPKSDRVGIVVFEHHGCSEHSEGQPG